LIDWLRWKILIIVSIPVSTSIRTTAIQLNCQQELNTTGAGNPSSDVSPSNRQRSHFGGVPQFTTHKIVPFSESLPPPFR
jgi:hypothetical protein